MGWLLGLLSVLALAGCDMSGAAEDELTVFAAASLGEVATDLGDAFVEAESGPLRLAFNVAGSNSLALQIEASGQADVFLSADEAWVDHVIDAGWARAEDKRAFASNRLVLVGRADVEGQAADLVQLASDSETQLVLADPMAVPAGRYARRRLERLRMPDGRRSLWEALQGRVVPMSDVRAALGLVEADPRLYGIVYATDLKGVDKLRVIQELEAEGDDPILYWALSRGGMGGELGRRFVAFLLSERGQRILSENGFLAVR